MAKKSSSSIIPLGDRVLVRVNSEKEAERKLESGIILPSSVKGDRDATKRGEVVAIGPGKYDDGELQPIQGIKEGDTVLFSWGDQITVNGTEYYLITESNILAIITE
jgi:co-chaperonin GroES (HSP10)